MKKITKIVLGVATLVCATLLSACGNSGGSNESDGNTITLWSFTTMKPQIEEYERQNPDGYKIEEVVVPYADFQTKLDQVLGTDQQPDMVALDAGFVSKYVASGRLADLEEYGVTDAAEGNFQFTLDVGKDSSGKQVAISYQAAPGAMYYRASILQEYLGIDPDDQEAAQAAFSDWEQVGETAQTIKEASDGNVFLFSSLQEIYQPIIGARSTGWVDEDKNLQIDDSMLDSLDIMKQFVDNGWTQNAEPQQGDWFSGMSSDNIAAYSLPSWGLFYWLDEYSKDTSGDWRVVQGPNSYSWGGTWFGAIKGSKNEENAARLSIYWSTDEEFQTWQARENSDFVAAERINEVVGEGYSTELLGGQNPYPVFSRSAVNINGKTFTEYDQNIQDLWIDNVINPYANGQVTKDRALEMFKQNVKTAYPDINVD